MAFTYANILDTKNRTSGIADYFLWAPISHFDINGIKSPPDVVDAVTNAATVTISDDHVFLLDKGFLRVNCAPGKNMYDAAMMGEQASLKLGRNIKVFIPGSDADMHAQISRMMNEPMVALVKDSNCPANLWYQLGSNCQWAYVKEGSFKTGSNRDGVKGFEITIECPGAAIIFYAGMITYPS